MIRSVVVFGLLVLTGCSKTEDASPVRQDGPTRAVSAARVERRALGGSLTVPGLLVAREEAAVVSQVAGYRVAKVLADEGDTVRRGQTLLVLDPTLIDAKLAQGRAAVAEATARSGQASGEAARVRGLDGSGVLSDEQIATRRFQAASARAAVAVARAQLRDLEVQRQQMVVRAPVAGVILQRSVRPGDLSGSAGDPAFRIARGGLVELDAEVPENVVGRVTARAGATVTLPSGETIEGHVRFVSPRVDPETKLTRVRIALPIDPRLRPGGFGRATLSRGDGSVAAVPEPAIRYEATGPYVVAIDSLGRARNVAVRTGAHGGGWVALAGGPPVGTRVALGGGAFLLDGDRVRVEEAR